MNTSIDDNLEGKKININKMEPLPLNSNENSPQLNAENAPSSFMKKTYSKLINNIKTLALKKENPPEEQKASEDVSISSSQEQQEETSPQTCKDKVANTIISKIEVKKIEPYFFLYWPLEVFCCA